MNASKLTQKFWLNYCKAIEYNKIMSPNMEDRWKIEDKPMSLSKISNKNIERIGYIVATCSPVTRAHLALAQQSANDLNLDAVFFILWPFYYISGFHIKPVEMWVSEQQHLSWENRFELLSNALADIDDERIINLDESKNWYIESMDNYNNDDNISTFWTGTWYIMRKLQWWIKHFHGPEVEFTFVCGMDQLIPNVDSLVGSEGICQVWQDYCISQHIAIHNMYVIPRLIDNTEMVEAFNAPFGCDHKVIIGSPLAQERFSATKIRFNRLDEGLKLEDYVTPSVATQIKNMKWWGYTS